MSDLEERFGVVSALGGYRSSMSSELEEAARAYVAARVANEQAEPSDWTAARARIDGAYLRLLELAGFGTEEPA